MTVGGLVLAAGAGRRFGRPKALVEFDGERLVDRMVWVLREGGCQPLLVVAGAAPLVVSGATVIDNPDWRTGMGSSLRAGLAALPQQVTAVVIVLVDTPWLAAEAVRRLVRAHEAGAELAVSTYAGERGHPVLLGRGHWAALRHRQWATAAPAHTSRAAQPVWLRSTAPGPETPATSITRPNWADRDRRYDPAVISALTPGLLLLVAAYGVAALVLTAMVRAPREYW